jgi:archaellum component FlaC
MDDVNEIESVLELEFENRKAATSTIIERVAPNITEDSKPGEIFEALMQDQDVAGRVKKEEDKKRVRKLAELIAKQNDKSSDNIKRVVLDAAGIEAGISEQREKLQTLRQKVSDIEKIREIKDNLDA